MGRGGLVPERLKGISKSLSGFGVNCFFCFFGHCVPERGFSMLGFGVDLCACLEQCLCSDLRGEGRGTGGGGERERKRER